MFLDEFPILSLKLGTAHYFEFYNLKYAALNSVLSDKRSTPSPWQFFDILYSAMTVYWVDWVDRRKDDFWGDFRFISFFFMHRLINSILHVLLTFVNIACSRSSTQTIIIVHWLCIFHWIQFLLRKKRLCFAFDGVYKYTEKFVIYEWTGDKAHSQWEFVFLNNRSAYVNRM